MADNYLEYHREDYERRKALWLSKKSHKRPSPKRTGIQRPDDESL